MGAEWRQASERVEKREAPEDRLPEGDLQPTVLALRHLVPSPAPAALSGFWLSFGGHPQGGVL